MHIFRISKLKQQLELNNTQVGWAIPYLIANVSIVCLALGLPSFGYNDPDLFEIGVTFLHWVLQAIIAMIGVRIAFRVNGGDHGIQFFERINSIGFVLFIRFLCGFAIIATVIFSTKVGRSLLPQSWESVYLLLLCVAALFWFRLVFHVKSLNKVKISN
ncbi:hypothetical protein [Undibacterium sp.]|uniref:hypothetical protein n=1 Tax=Undibacterium sp. TaxID=1914977 RepID=UPI003753324F